MYNFVLQTVMFVSLGIVVLLVARALPRVPDRGTPQQTRMHSFFDRMISKRIPLDKLDSFAQSFSEKVLRKTKVIVMKTDNFVDDHLDRVKRVKERSRDGESIKEHVDKITESKNENGAPDASLQNDETSL